MFVPLRARRKSSKQLRFYQPRKPPSILAQSAPPAIVRTRGALACIRGNSTGDAYTRVMRYLHTMLRVRDLDAALDFFVNKLGLVESRRRVSDKGRYTLVFLTSGAPGDAAEVELTYNWDQAEAYSTGRFFGHLAYVVEDLYATCERLQAAGVEILRPPRDGHMAFVQSPDGHSIELLQRGDALPPREPWVSMPNQGTW